MKDRIKEIVDDIAMMIVMSTPEDAASLAIIAELVGDIVKLTEPDLLLVRLKDAAIEVAATQEPVDFYNAVSEFVEATTLFLDNPSASKFKAEKSVASKNIDSAADLDPRFITEFIEAHRLQLDEFEGSLLDHKISSSDPVELAASTKRYLHTLKGDAGSVGLVGIERVCHAIEDRLLTSDIIGLIDALFGFKEWVVSCLNSYEKGEDPTESSDLILSELGLSKKSEQTQSDAAPRLLNPDADSLAFISSIAEVKKYTLTGDSDIVAEFVAEAEEHLGKVEEIVLDAKGIPSKNDIDTLFRAVHSLKGGAAYFSIEETTNCSHKLESMMQRVREGKKPYDDVLNSILLTYVDVQKNVLSRVKVAARGDQTMVFEPASTQLLNSLIAAESGTAAAAIPISSIDNSAPKIVANASPKANPVIPNSSQAPEKSKSAIDSSSANNHGSKDPQNRGESGDKLNVKNFVKVDTSRLDQLIDAVGEMAIYSSMLIKICREHLSTHETAMIATRQVEKFSRDLQDIGMSMRLVPIKALFQRMSRLVWDTGKRLTKEINFVMEGEDTELDRNLIDKIADPLLHMIRNSVDHGIELPDVREAKGKPRLGTVRLSAFYSGGSVHIQIADDGKGLDPQMLYSKAIEKGIIEAGTKLSEQECLQLIFAPGFSTAAEVTDLSGRGVGMDVVRRNVDSIRGRIQIDSQVGRGSIFTIEIPLTLAMIDGIEVRVGGESYIVPSLAIVEFIRPSQEMLSTTLDRGETMHFRGHYLPIFRLSELYRIEGAVKDFSHGAMVVVENGSERVAIFVDEILGEYSTVIKTLGSMFDSSTGFAGCAIMPSGDVSLILDIRSLVDYARENYCSIRRHPHQAEKERAETSWIH